MKAGWGLKAAQWVLRAGSQEEHLWGGGPVPEPIAICTSVAGGQ